MLLMNKMKMKFFGISIFSPQAADNMFLGHMCLVHRKFETHDVAVVFSLFACGQWSLLHAGQKDVTSFLFNISYFYHNWL